MSTVLVHCYGALGNNAILRIPDRRFPGVLVQGDTLRNLVSMAQEVFNRAKVSNDDDLVGDAELLLTHLSAMLDEYKIVLRQHGIELP